MNRAVAVKVTNVFARDVEVGNEPAFTIYLSVCLFEPVKEPWQENAPALLGGTLYSPAGQTRRGVERERGGARPGHGKIFFTPSTPSTRGVSPLGIFLTKKGSPKAV